MKFNRHSELEGLHAFLSASKYHWINYDYLKLEDKYRTHKAASIGTELHEYAKRSIELGISLPRNKKTLNQYVNDAIGFKMSPEVVLYYSPNCFGTVDAISFKKNTLRIHDLKTGSTKASINQLYVYAALFCLEYNKKPGLIKTELRIYQNDSVFIEEADPEFIAYIMDKIISFDKHINDIMEEE